MYKITWNIGNGRLNDTRKLEQRDRIEIELACEFGGCTIKETHGSWHSPTGRIDSESGWEITVVSEHNIQEKAEEIAKGWMKEYHEESIMMTAEVVAVNFLEV